MVAARSARPGCAGARARLSRRRGGAHRRRRPHARRRDGKAPAALGILDRQHGGGRVGDRRRAAAPRQRGGTPRPLLGDPGSGPELRHRHWLRVPTPRPRHDDHAGDARVPGERVHEVAERMREYAPSAPGRGDAVVLPRRGPADPGSRPTSRAARSSLWSVTHRGDVDAADEAIRPSRDLRPSSTWSSLVDTSTSRRRATRRWRGGSAST